MLAVEWGRVGAVENTCDLKYQLLQGEVCKPCDFNKEIPLLLAGSLSTWSTSVGLLPTISQRPSIVGSHWI